MRNIPFHDEAALLDRLINGYKDKRQFVFLIGSGLSCPKGDAPGVLSVGGIIDLVREELSPDLGVIKQLDEEVARKPTDEYQISFQHLGGRRSPGCASRIIRKAVLAARIPSAAFESEELRLSSDDYIRTNECEAICDLLEQDLDHWHIRPGLSSLGTILTDYSEIFASSVITTNFDPLLEVSIQKANGKRPESWGLSADAPSHWPRPSLDRCRILHIHGLWSNTDTLHTRLVLERERPNLEIELANIVRERVLVVVGYGGWDDALVRVILRANHDVNGATNVLWAFHQKSKDEIYSRYDPLLAKLLEGVGGTRVVFYRGIDADRFFPALQLRLETARNLEAGTVLPHEDSTEGPLIPEVTEVEPVSVEAASGPPPQTDGPQSAPEQLISDATADFMSSLRKREPESVSVLSSGELPLNDPDVQEPNFLLFEREGALVMVVVPSESSVNEYGLQKTTEPQIKATLLAKDRVKLIGFVDGKVHPMFANPNGKIVRVFWDSSLLVQAILFPESKLALPIYHQDGTEQKALASIECILAELRILHGDKLIFASVSTHEKATKPNRVLEGLLANTSYITRFAPTPSNQLHLGNARTALASYLMGLKDKQRSRFFLRIDNTDYQRSKPHFVPVIKEEVRWLGLQWDDASEFQQSDPEAFQTYKRLLRILQLADFTEQHSDGKVFLKSLPQKDYYCVHYDWRDGAVITHQPPLSVDKVTYKRSIKAIKLFRAEGDNAYYQYAGLVDDIRCLSGRPHLTCVIRDNGQKFLTRVQAHIRYALELARQKLQSSSDAQHLFQESGIDPLRSIPVPLYLHLPVVTDNGEARNDRPVEGTNRDSRRYTVLHKREKDESALLEKYTLEYLRHQERLLPESIVAYLVATIIPSKSATEDWKTHLGSISMVFGHLGVQAALQFFARRFIPDDLVHSQKQIRCRLKDIRSAERIVVGSLPLWRLRQKLTSRETKDATPALDAGLLERVASHLSDFAGFSQILKVIQRPGNTRQLSPVTSELLTRWLSQPAANEGFIETLRKEIQRMRSEVKELTPSARETGFSELSQVLRDLRYALTDAETSPKIEPLLAILGENEALVRIRQCL